MRLKSNILKKAAIFNLVDYYSFISYLIILFILIVVSNIPSCEDQYSNTEFLTKDNNLNDGFYWSKFYNEKSYLDDNKDIYILDEVLFYLKTSNPIRISNDKWNDMAKDTNNYDVIDLIKANLYSQIKYNGEDYYKYTDITYEFSCKNCKEKNKKFYDKVKNKLKGEIKPKKTTTYIKGQWENPFLIEVNKEYIGINLNLKITNYNLYRYSKSDNYEPLPW
jgi:hypothetical protein